MSISYKDSGVDIKAGEEAVKKIKENVISTHSPAVLSDLGGFGGAYDIKKIIEGYENPVIVQSTDSVGTKVMVAAMLNKYDTIGRDLVGNVVGDILVMGARPITFLDYLAYNKIDPDRIERIVSGISYECKQSNMSLIGGEMAELPGVYRENETDIVGFVTGVVERDKIVTGKNIKSGDVVMGFASSGLHTNGFSLARKLFFEIAGHDVNTKLPELEKSVGETLLEPHTNYTNPILDILDSGIEVKGMAHITGGGLLENIPRILPEGCGVEIKKDSYPMLPVFEVMQKIGDVEESEMYRTFNMGIGMVLILDSEEAKKIKDYDDFKLYKIGKVVEGDRSVILNER